jgi:predicted RNA-binding Zn-ribbon protein involved in translation (DUF1610 family)
MPIKVQCPNPACGSVITVRNEYAGKRGKCPSCGAAMMIPTAAVREALLARQQQQEKPRGGIPVEAGDTAGLSPLTPMDELRLPASDVPEDAASPEPPSPSAPPAGLLFGYSIAELATRTALIIGIAALVLLSFLPQVHWLYLSGFSKEQDSLRLRMLQHTFIGGLAGEGLSVTLLAYSMLLASLSILCLLLLELLPRDKADPILAAVGAMACGWGVTVLFWLFGYVWKAFAVASEIGSKDRTVLPGFGLVLSLFSAVSIILVFGYLVASRRRFFWLLAAGLLGFFFGVFLVIFSVRPWDMSLFTGLGRF